MQDEICPNCHQPVVHYEEGMYLGEVLFHRKCLQKIGTDIQNGLKVTGITWDGKLMIDFQTEVSA